MYNLIWRLRISQNLHVFFFNLLRRNIVDVQNGQLCEQIFPSSVVCLSRIIEDNEINNVTTGTKSKTKYPTYIFIADIRRANKRVFFLIVQYVIDFPFLITPFISPKIVILKKKNHFIFYWPYLYTLVSIETSML